MDPSSRGGYRWRSAAALLVLFVVLRGPFLAQDCPADLGCYYQDVASPVFDEGWWTANARQHALTGHWTGTGLDLAWISPVFTGLFGIVFAIARPDLVTARFVSLALGAAGLLLLWRMGRGRTRTGLLAAVLLAASFAGAHLGRLALPETLGTTLGLAGAWLLLRGGRGTIAAGILAGLAILAKPHFAFLLPAFLATSFLLARRHGERGVAALARVAAGAFVPLAAWTAWLTAHAAPVRAIVDFYDSGRWLVRAPADLPPVAVWLKPLLQTLAVGVVYRHPLLVHLPGIFLLGALALPAAVAGALRSDGNRRLSVAPSVPDEVVLFAMWALAGGAFVSLLPFQPLRYFIPLLPAWVYLAAWILTAQAGPGAAPGLPHRASNVLRTLLTWAVLAQVLFAIFDAAIAPGLVARATAGDLDPLHPVELHLTGFLLELLRTRSLATFGALRTQQAYIAALVLGGAVSLGLGALGTFLLGRRLRGSFRPGFLSASATRASLIALLAYQAILWVSWWPHRATTVRDLGRDLPHRLDASAVVSPGGTYALESALQFDSSAVRRHAMLDATGNASHFLSLESHPLLGRVPAGGVERALPGTTRIASYSLTGGFVYGLYRCRGPAAVR